MWLIRPPEISGTWMHQGTSRVPSSSGLYWPNAGEPLAVTGTSLDPSQPLPKPMYQPRSSLPAAQPHLERRHRDAGVLVQQRDQPVDVVALERVHVAGQQIPLRLRERPVTRLGRPPGPLAAIVAAGALQRAVHRDHRGVEQLGHLGGLPAQHLAQDQHRPLPGRQVLQGRDEGQPDAVLQHHPPGRIGVRRHAGHRRGSARSRPPRAAWPPARCWRAPGPTGPSAGPGASGCAACPGRRWWRSGTARSAAADRPSNRSKACQARTMVSCTASSASCADPSIR